MGFEPRYVALLKSGELKKRMEEARDHLGRCDCCPWVCDTDRLSGKTGACRLGSRVKVSSYGAHHGEEDVLSGRYGSGTIFFTSCNMRCQFCQNYDISQSNEGVELDPEGLATIMLELQEVGCHNINLVTPSHVGPQIIAAVYIAAQEGLRLPLVYNTGGYDALPMLKLLDGIIDIYMPDMKYSNPQVGLHYSRVRNYPQHNQAAVREMHRQVGDLQIDPGGLARHGLLVRHLVLPDGAAGTADVVRFLAEEISKDTYINIMDQYFPTYQARLYPRLNRYCRQEETAAARQMAREVGLHRFDKN